MEIVSWWNFLSFLSFISYHQSYCNNFFVIGTFSYLLTICLQQVADDFSLVAASLEVIFDRIL